MKLFPFYRQYDTMDCGPTCLRMIAKYYKKDYSAQQLRERAQIGKEGVNLLGISESANTIGFKTQSLKLKYSSLISDAHLPAILHWNQNHFVILYKVNNQKLYIADPAKGLINYTPNEFKEHWVTDKIKGKEEGIALLLEPTPAFFAKDSEMISSLEESTKLMAFKNIFKYILPYKNSVLKIFICLTAATLLQLVLPFITRSVVDKGINKNDLHFITIILLAQLALLTGRLVVDFVRNRMLLHIGIHINITILTDFLIKLMKLPLSFFDSKRTGDILQRMNDHSRIESFLTGSSLNTLFALINLLVFSIVLIFFNAQIFFVFIIASILYSIWVAAFLKKRRRLDYKRFDVSAKEQGITIQLVQGMQEIKLYGAQSQMRNTWKTLQNKLFVLSMKGLSINQLQQGGSFLINECKNILVTFLSAKAVIDEQITLGSMIAIQYIMGQLNSPIEQMIGFVQSWQNAKISMDRLNEIHKIEDEEPANKPFQQQLPASFAKKLASGFSANHEKNITYKAVKGVVSISQAEKSILLPSINFKNVSFTYTGAGNEPILKNINFAIPKGKTTAIVGMSGSGKTTLLKLLLKIYEPQIGEIMLDDTPLSTFSHRIWRKHCGVVMQDSFIFSDTIIKNISVWEGDINKSLLHQAIDVANIHEFINSLPLGLDTKIGPEGTGISMGQRQRILIARAVYRNPEFIFFDEATNSLDANNENIILKNLENFFAGRTVVVVAHRLSTVKHADQIVVLDKGEIVEKGNHSELVNLKGKYYALVKNQLELGA